MNPLEDNPKLVSARKLAAIRDELDARGKKLSLTNGCFDLLHSGHIFFLRNASKLGDKFAVLLNADKCVRELKGATRPVQTQLQRAYALAALECVDYVCIFDTPRATAQLSQIRPHVYAKAGDYTVESLNPQERKALEDAEARIVFLEFLKGFSTTALIKKICDAAESGF